ncbi:uncharacterized protein LOC113750905 [Coffea eugenioides]|uniref:uncharacterized protein LOC113750905 n=1 Tax=Coffea eugenioides TaxID=49369 RepID=UPI000F606CD1|nr:uncharacterized protein LOC113750905 [Coffea eugenioides]
MSGRTFVLILFFWALLTIVTPMLVRLSASAKPHVEFKAKGETREEMYTRRFLEMLPRRALVPTMLHKAPLAPEPPASAPAPEPEPEPEPSLVVNGLEHFVDGDKLIPHKAHELLLR